MATVNCTVSPKLGIGNQPITQVLDDGTRMAFVTIVIPTGTTYSQTDRCVLTGNYEGDFSRMYGANIIKQVLAGIFGFPSLSTSTVKFEWISATQKGMLRQIGNGGSVAPTGPIDEAELANAFSIAAGPINAEALIFY